jgi:predicted phage terminase large subunit-like protein
MKNPLAQLTLAPESLKQKTREKLQASFSAFCRAAWSQIEPRSLEWSWHHELIAEYLQLAFERQERRLIFCQPPRTLKSRLISVLFPVWCWAKDPALSFLQTSYSDTLSEELSLLRRNLLAGAWFQDLFPGKVLFDPDQNQKWKFANTAHGQMLATSMAGTALGQGCDFLVCDDAASPEMSFSAAERTAVNRSFDGTFRSRLNSAEEGCIIIVQQRLHQDDLVGHVLESEPNGWTCVSLPMIAEVDEEIIFPLSGRVMNRRAGDLLHPAKFSRKWCEKQRTTVGSYIWSGQYQQRPGVLGGSIFQTKWFRQYDRLPDEKKGMTVLSLDTAFSTKKSADYSVATVWTAYGTGFFLRYVWRERADYPHLKAMTEALAEDFHAEAVLVEEKASGQSLLQSLKQETSLPVVGIPADTDKISRAHAVTPLFESGRIFFPVNERWMADYLHELELFPSSKFNDQVDSTTQALTYLRSRTYGGGILGVVKMLQKMAKLGESPYKAPALTAAGGQVLSVRDKPEPCPLCGGPRIWMSHGMDPNRLVAFCNQDGSKDGVPPGSPGNNACPNYPGEHQFVTTGGQERCMHCQYTPDLRAVQSYNGITHAQLKSGSWRRLGQFALNNERSGPGILGRNDDSDRIDAMVERTLGWRK